MRASNTPFQLVHGVQQTGIALDIRKKRKLLGPEGAVLMAGKN